MYKYIYIHVTLVQTSQKNILAENESMTARLREESAKFASWPLHPPTHLGIGATFSWKIDECPLCEKGDEHPRAPVVWNCGMGKMRH